MRTSRLHDMVQASLREATAPEHRTAPRVRAGWSRLLAALLVLGVAAGPWAGTADALEEDEPSATTPAAATTLTLAESLELALEHSPRLGIALSRTRQSQAQVDQAEAMLRPRLDTSGTLAESKTPSSVRNPNPQLGLPPAYTEDSITSGSVGMTYAQVLLPTGETRVQLEQVRLAPAAARAQEQLDRLALLAEVEGAYLGVLEAQSGLELARLLERNALAAAEVVRDQAETGMATELDVLAAETGASRASQGRRAAEDGLEMAWKAFYQVLGVEPPDRWPALEPVAYPSSDALLVGMDLEGLQEQARQGRPEMLQAQIGLEQARLQLEQAELQRRPSLALQGSYQTEDGEDAVSVALTDQAALQVSLDHNEADFLAAEESWQVGLRVTWNLLDGGAAAAAVREAQEAVTQAELSLRQLEAGIALELSQHHSALTQAMLETAAAQRSVTEARGRYERVQAQAETGAATRLQVWDAEAALAQARHQKVQALHSLLQARTQLAKAGGFPPDRLQELIAASAGGE